MKQGGPMVMRASSIMYYISDALKSLKRNKTISLASAVTVAATLFIMGIFLIFMENVNMGMKNIQSRIEVKVFLMDKISAAEQSNIGEKLKKIPGVKDIQFENKTEALKKFSDQMSEQDKSLLEGYNSNNNPMPNAYIVRLDNPEVSEQVINYIKDVQGIESVGNDKELIDNIIAVSKSIRWIGIVIFILMVGVSLFLISNTIKLTVYSRRREIGIMKFVGATDWFIIWPFIIEGAVIGLIGAAFANLILYYTYNIIFAKLSESFLLVKLIEPSYIMSTILWQFIASGVVIGSIGSTWSLYKFLKV